MATPRAPSKRVVQPLSRRLMLQRAARLTWGGLVLAHASAVRAAADTASSATALGGSAALPPELVATLPGAQALGAATLRFLGLDIYAARLWVPNGFNAITYAQSPLALELTYLRALSGQRIAERSLKEMRRQSTLGAAQEQAWLDAMLQAFPDVKAGDRISGLHTPGVGARFWFNAVERPAVRDAEFSRLFFGIWLSEASSEPQMRASLLGRRPP